MTERMLAHPPGITFSHGGPGEFPSYPAVDGSVPGSNGNPIEVWRAAGGGLNWPALILLSTGTLTASCQGSIGPQLSDGTIDPNSWFTFGSFNMSAGTAESIACPPMFGWIRTKIISRSSGELTSGVGPIAIAPGKVVKAQYPTLKAGGN